MTDFNSAVLIYASIVLLNFIVAAILYTKSSNRLHRQLCIVWLSTGFALFIQGVFSSSIAAILVSLIANFIHSLSLLNLMVILNGIPSLWRRFTLIFIMAYIPAIYFYVNGYIFSVIALFPVVAVALPLYYAGIKSLYLKNLEKSLSMKCLSISYLLFALHYMDFPFVRMNPELSLFGFSLGVMIIFSISLFSLSCAVETIIKEKNKQIQSQLENKIKEQQPFVNEFKFASDLQQQFMPKLLPKVKNYQFEHEYMPAKQVSGDFFDVHVFGKDVLGFIIFDVMGKGLPSSFITIKLHTLFHSVSKENLSAKGMLNFLNKEISVLDVKMKISVCFYMQLNIKTNTITYADTGMGVCYLIRNGTLIELREGGGFPLGGLKDAEYTDATLNIDIGDTILVGTDGIVDMQTHTDKIKYGEARLKTFLKNRDWNANTSLSTALLDELKMYTNDTKFTNINDDITWFTIKRLG